jgi:hypothetical protein
MENSCYRLGDAYAVYFDVVTEKQRENEEKRKLDACETS